jgi:ankyrin repeat protein
MRTRLACSSVLTSAAVSLFVLAHGSVVSAAPDLRLLEAVQRHDRAAVDRLLKQHVDVNASRGDGLTALALAVHLDDEPIVDVLIRSGANVNAANDLGITPLMLAATNGNAPIVEKLLAAKADPNAARSTGETPMVFAARTGRTAVIKALVAAGARAEDKIGPRGQTPLMWAAAEGHADAVKLLIEAGADVNAATKSNKVPAPNGHYVAKRPPLERKDKTRSVITILWPKDGDEDMFRYDGGMTPLFFAIDGGYQDVVGVLLDNGVKVDGPNPDGLTPLQFAMIRRNEPLALYLLSRGADPSNPGPGFPPLHVACYLGQTAIAKELIARGVDVNVRLEKPYRLIELLEVGTNRYPGSGLFTNIGSTPFMTAAKHGQIEIMHMLLAKGADPFLTARGGENALMVAAGLGRPEPTNVTYHVFKESDQLEAIKICLDLGLDINATNQWGQTALHGAAFHDFPRVIELLAANGAWLDPTDWQDQTPLRIAQGHEICCSTFHRMPLSAAALLKAGADPKAGVLLKFAAHDYVDDSVAKATDSKDKHEENNKKDIAQDK